MTRAAPDAKRVGAAVFTRGGAKKEKNMKKKLYLGGIAALALSLVMGLSGCDADIGVIGGADGPVEVYVGDNVISIDENEDQTSPDEPLPDPAEPDADMPSQPAAEDPGTAGGEEDAQLYEDGSGLDPDGTYNSAEEVALYLDTYGCLPSNYITKNEARELGWTGGSVERVAPGCAIGGDKFGNREGVLPDGTYHECDIDTIGGDSRGAKRLVYSDDGRIYYTEDHYETFTLLYGEE